ncbi:MAG: FliI/YscN family ATPase [Deltaproteobacteria bacterium]|nr:FliI/YscN family ATPase [Deltaproteobacteria bacterium]
MGSFCIPLLEWKQRLRVANPCVRSGRLEAVQGSSLLASLPGARLGEQVRIGPNSRPAEVIGFRGERALLLASGRRDQLGAGQRIVARGEVFRVAWSEDCLGRVLDASGRPMDGRPAPAARAWMPIEAPAPSPLQRRPIEHVLPTGLRAIDGLTCLGEGQRIGLFAPPGVGKSSLLGQIARHGQADCNVICLVGERGRELGEFISDALGTEGMARSAIVCATSDAPAAERARALCAATALAEGFRARGQRVLLLVDSVTRFARAVREIALDAGEPPGRGGYPPSVFDRLAALVERAGTDERGSITAIYTVLTEHEAEEDPLAEELRSLLDGHILLSTELARQGCFPAVDPIRSLSRLMDRLVDDEHRLAARSLRALAAAWEARRDLIAAGAYEPGSEPETDRAIALRPAMLDFLRQERDERCPLASCVEKLVSTFGGTR